MSQKCHKRGIHPLAITWPFNFVISGSSTACSRSGTLNSKYCGNYLGSGGTSINQPICGEPSIDLKVLPYLGKYWFKAGKFFGL
jgi:hypothetical protein